MGPTFIMEDLMGELHLPMTWQFQELGYSHLVWPCVGVWWHKETETFCLGNNRNENGGLTWGFNAQKAETGGSLQVWAS